MAWGNHLIYLPQKLVPFYTPTEQPPLNVSVVKINWANQAVQLFDCLENSDVENSDH